MPDPMKPREIVRRTLEFDAPPRVPRQMWLLPWASQNHPVATRRIQERYPDDIVSSPAFLETPLPTQGDHHGIGTYIDEWGSKWQGLQAGIIGEVKEPVLADWGNLDRLRPPRECLTVDVAQVNAFCRDTDRYVLAGCCPRPFERLQFLRGTENLMCDLFVEPAELTALIRILHELYVEELELWARTDVEGLMVMDDWGSQNGLLIRPALWRRLFRPLYAEYVEIARAHGKDAFLHSDGHILDIYEDFIEVGFDAINSQVFCMGLETMEERFAGRVTFWGDFDRQHLLPQGSPTEIRDAAHALHERLYRNGGLIAQCEFGPGANPDNVEAFFAFWDE